MARFEVVGAADYYYLLDTKTGEQLFAGQFTKQELEAKAARLNEGYANIENGTATNNDSNVRTETSTASTSTPAAKSTSSPEAVTPSSNPKADNGTEQQPIQQNTSSTADGDKGEKTPSKKEAVTAGQGVGLPNRRQYNPLSDFSSYNYQLSLYMVTPEASNKFISSGMTQVGNGTSDSNGFYLLAQSGGINNSLANEPGGNKRAPGFELDFYIDDLKFKTITSLKDQGSASAQSASFEFNIYEPFGLSFTSRLTTAAKAMQESSTLPGFDGEANALGQFYVLGIRFYGYDKNGEIVTADQYNGSDNASTKTDNQALFERFYSLKISSFKFKLDGKMTVYNIQATALSMTESFGAKRGQIGSNATLSGSTVKEMLTGKNGLLTKMNKEEAASAEKRRKEAKNKNKATIVANSYHIEFEPNSGIEDAVMVDPKDFAKYKTVVAMNSATSTKDSNPANEGKASTNKGIRNLTITSGSHMVAAVEQVIKQSSYIKDMMTKVDSALSEDNPAVNGSPAEVAWFTVTPGIEVLGYDSVLNDYAYKITYYVQRYIVPFVRTAMVSKTSTYPGPHKKYEYWYTGKNTEVLSYEQTYNNLYFLTGVSNSPNESSPPIPKVDKPQPGNQTGAQNKAAESVNALAVDLYDPGSTVMGKMTIMGDPDYLSQTLGSSMNSVFEKFYGPDGYTVNANGGQVFVELDFKTAEDYNSGTDPEVPAGTLSINDNIRYYNYDASVKDSIKGITFELKWVNSTFSKGKFTQEIEMYATDLASFAKKNETTKDSGREQTKKAPKKKPPKATQADVRRVDNAIDEANSRKERNNVYTSDTGGFDAMGNYTGDYDNGSSNSSSSSASKQRPDDDNSSSGKKKVVSQGRGASREYDTTNKTRSYNR